MWVIRDQDSTIYLVGTAHLLRHGIKWHSAKLQKALVASSELWLEIADPENEAGVAPSGPTLRYRPEKAALAEIVRQRE